ncbi:hypothetical protein [Aureimonas leprariae]|uniref:Uncharacterized protein n=1 Tax=Plantimonas leprariae TaxID=2615207 RepID=A0A7V7PN88_9HYPH|nr:hypothetical protein [Aureimonas leprariae]KAB0679082.1 hypothetical protein F6X38_14415 [Aureimonas leprariae]
MRFAADAPPIRPRRTGKRQLRAPRFDRTFGGVTALSLADIPGERLRDACPDADDAAMPDAAPADGRGASVG